MNNIKRTIAIIAILSFIFSSTVVTLASTDTDSSAPAYDASARKVLSALKIIDAFTDESYDGSVEVTRAQFAQIITRILKISDVDESDVETGFEDVSSDDELAASIAVVSKLGIMKGDDKHFFPQSTITYEQAIKIILQIMKYDKMAQNKGGYPLGYLMVAADLGLTKKISGNLGDPMTQDKVIQMIYNSLNIDVMQQTGFGSEAAYSVEKGKTFLTEVLEVQKDKGIVKGTFETQLTGESSLSKSEVLIDDQIYKIGTTDVEKFLGYKVTYYYESDDSDTEHVLLYVEPSEDNEVLMIDADKIHSFSDNTYSYEKEDADNKFSKAGISESADIVYNGKAIEYPFNNYVPNQGKVTLIDYDGNKKYDIVMIQDYEIYVVEWVNITDKIIYDKYSSTKQLVADVDNPNLSIDIKDNKGKALLLTDIKKGDILSVAESKDKTVKRIVVTRDKIEGTVNEVGGSTADYSFKLTVDGKEYRVVKSFYEIGNPEINVDDTGVFRFDMDGKIAAFERKSSTDFISGYLIDAGKKQGLSQQLQFKIYAPDEKISTISGAKKIKIDDILYDDASMILDKLTVSSATIPSTLGIDINKYKYTQLIRFKFNDDGEIDCIDTVAPYTGALSGTTDGLRFDYAPNTNFSHYKTAGQTFDGRVRLGAETILFFVPTDFSRVKDFEYKKALGTLANDQGYNNVNVYCTTDNAVYSNIVLIYRSSSGGNIANTEPIMLVSNITTTINSAGETVKKITGLYNGKEISWVEQKQDMLARVEEGDIIRTKLDKQGEIQILQHVFDLSGSRFALNDPTSTTSNPTSSDINYQCRFVYGNVYSKTEGTVRFTTGNPSLVSSITDLELINADKCRIYVYDTAKKNNPAYLATVNDIIDYKHSRSGYSRIVLMTNWGDANAMVIYK